MDPNFGYNSPALGTAKPVGRSRPRLAKQWKPLAGQSHWSTPAREIDNPFRSVLEKGFGSFQEDQGIETTRNDQGTGTDSDTQVHLKNQGNTRFSSGDIHFKPFENILRRAEQKVEFSFTSKLDSVATQSMEFKTPDMKGNLFFGLNRKVEPMRESAKETRSTIKRGKWRKPVQLRFGQDFVFGENLQENAESNNTDDEDLVAATEGLDINEGDQKDGELHVEEPPHCLNGVVDSEATEVSSSFIFERQDNEAGSSDTILPNKMKNLNIKNLVRGSSDTDLPNKMKNLTIKETLSTSNDEKVVDVSSRDNGKFTFGGSGDGNEMDNKKMVSGVGQATSIIPPILTLPTSCSKINNCEATPICSSISGPLHRFTEESSFLKNALQEAMTNFLQILFKEALNHGLSNIRTWWNESKSTLQDVITNRFRANPMPLMRHMDTFLVEVDIYLANRKQYLECLTAKERDEQLKSLDIQITAGNIMCSSLEARISKLNFELDRLRDELQTCKKNTSLLEIKKATLEQAQIRDVTIANSIDQKRKALEDNFLQLIDID